MSHRRGKDFYAQFSKGGTTVVLNTNYRSWSYDGEVGLLDTTSGADEDEEHILGLRRATGSFTTLDDQGDAAFGTLNDIVYEGSQGTLAWSGPAGSAAGNPKYQCPVTIQSASQPIEYNTEVSRTYNWTKNGAWIDHPAIAGGGTWPGA